MENDELVTKRARKFFIISFLQGQKSPLVQVEKAVPSRICGDYTDHYYNCVLIISFFKRWREKQGWCTLHNKMPAFFHMHV